MLFALFSIHAVFQFTPLREGRHAFVFFVAPHKPVFQFTPLREGRQTLVEKVKELPDISIHAPPRGATRESVAQRVGVNDFNSRPSARGDVCVRCCVPACRIFQFTPLREGRLMTHSADLDTVPFQFTPLREGRQEAFDSLIDKYKFQFTPLREGRQADVKPLFLWNQFQFTPLREGRPTLLLASTAWNAFQFTPLREGRPFCICPPSTHTIFQFTPLREGRPALPAIPCRWRTISIHAPPRGATWCPKVVQCQSYFNSRPSARGDRALSPCLSSWIFQFTPLREGRLPSMNAIWRGFLFQFTPLREGRHFGISLMRFIYDFNSRPSARGDI